MFSFEFDRYRDGEWLLSYPGTKIIREPSPKRGRKTA